jgi:predicted metalloprotease with PDZ domain
MLTPPAGGPVVWRFEDYPTVVTVDDDSPAERAGVRRGDRILMIDGRELKDQDIVFAQLLKPGEKLPLRVERDGRTRDVTVLVERKPPTADVGCSSVDVRIGSLIREGPAAVVAAARSGPVGVQRVVPRVAPTPRGPTPEAPAVYVATPPTPPVEPVVMPPMPSTALLTPTPGGVVLLQQGATPSHLAVLGVDLMRLNAGLANRVGVDRGVLVLEVGRGTPGADAGLVPGDVIVSVNGVAITMPISILRAVQSADDRTARLGVIRKDSRKPVDVVVSW